MMKFFRFECATNNEAATMASKVQARLYKVPEPINYSVNVKDRLVYGTVEFKTRNMMSRPDNVEADELLSNELKLAMIMPHEWEG
jgi:hypothetical protein